MGLKFERDDSLDRMFEAFAIDPDEKKEKEAKTAKDIERFLNPQPKKKKTNDQSAE